MVDYADIPTSHSQEWQVTSLYGVRQLIDSMRAVRANTILMAGDIPESKYDYRATPVSRSIAETLVHIAWLGTADRVLHEEEHLATLEGFDFPTLLRKSEAEEKRRRSKTEILELLRAEGERHSRWVEQLPESFLSGARPAAGRRFGDPLRDAPRHQGA